MPSSPASKRRQAPQSDPLGCVKLTYARLVDPEKEMDLVIPVDRILTWTRTPAKFVRFLAVYITGDINGHLELWEPSTESWRSLDSSHDGLVSAGETWRFVDGQRQLVSLDSATAEIDLASTLSSTASESWESSYFDDFRGQVEERDSACVFTGRPEVVCERMHLMRNSLGNDRFLDLLDVRPREPPLPGNEDLDCRLSLARTLQARRACGGRALDEEEEDRDYEPLIDIDHPTNGLLISADLHKLYVQRWIGIIATPNLVLNQEDVTRAPPRVPDGLPGINYLPLSMAFPTTLRYTMLPLQEPVYPIADAAFKTMCQLPSASICNYVFACHVLHLYGSNIDLFHDPAHAIEQHARSQAHRAKRRRLQARRRNGHRTEGSLTDEDPAEDFDLDEGGNERPEYEFWENFVYSNWTASKRRAKRHSIQQWIDEVSHVGPGSS